MTMNNRRSMAVALLAFTAAIVSCGFAVAGEGTFYKGPALFSTRPDEKRTVSSIDRFGPVGMGIELHQSVETGIPPVIGVADHRNTSCYIGSTITGQVLQNRQGIEVGRMVYLGLAGGICLDRRADWIL